jgi:hypothetical protein
MTTVTIRPLNGQAAPEAAGVSGHGQRRPAVRTDRGLTAMAVIGVTALTGLDSRAYCCRSVQASMSAGGGRERHRDAAHLGHPTTGCPSSLLESRVAGFGLALAAADQRGWIMTLPDMLEGTARPDAQHCPSRPGRG